MRYVFITLLLALLLKDITLIGDRYILRGLSEGIALSFGMWWLATHHLRRLARLHVVVFSYLVVLGLTTLVSQRPLFVILQVLSLASVTLFFIAYVEASGNNQVIFQSHRSAICTRWRYVCR